MTKTYMIAVTIEHANGITTTYTTGHTGATPDHAAQAAKAKALEDYPGAYINYCQPMQEIEPYKPPQLSPSLMPKIQNPYSPYNSGFPGATNDY